MVLKSSKTSLRFFFGRGGLLLRFACPSGLTIDDHASSRRRSIVPSGPITDGRSFLLAFAKGGSKTLCLPSVFFFFLGGGATKRANFCGRRGSLGCAALFVFGVQIDLRLVGFLGGNGETMCRSSTGFVNDVRRVI